MVDCCASAADGILTAHNIKAAAKAFFIIVPLTVRFTARTYKRSQWLPAEREWQSRVSAAPCDQPIDQQDDECADDGAYEISALSWLVPMNQMAEPAREQRAGDSEQDGNDAAARVPARHQQLCDHPGYAADDDPP